MYRMAFLVSIVAIALAACGGGAAGVNGSPNVSLPAMNAGPATSSGTPIKHVVIVIQENRSFDNLFATFPACRRRHRRADSQRPDRQAEAAQAGEHISCSTTAISPGLPITTTARWTASDLVYVNGHRCTCAYQYVKPSTIQPYWTMAKQYVLADHMFQTQSSGSFTAHQDLIRGGTAINSYESLVDFPTRRAVGLRRAARTMTSLLTEHGPVPEKNGVRSRA